MDLVELSKEKRANHCNKCSKGRKVSEVEDARYKVRLVAKDYN